MDFDECLAAVNSFGTYQKVVIYLVLLPAVVPCAFHAYNQIFISAVPSHRCRFDEFDDRNYSTAFVKNISIPRVAEEGGTNKYSKCSMHNYSTSDFEETIDSETQCKHGWIYDSSKYEATVVTEWNLVCDKDHYATIALVIFGVGGLLGNILFGYIQDSLGRRPAFFIYVVIVTVFGVASAFADSFTLWVVLRFGVGFTIPAILGTPYVLSVELVGPKKRAFCTVLVNIVYSVALIALSAVVYFVREWRKLTLITTVPFVVYMFYWWVLPESPRWLVAKGRFVEAEEILQKMAKMNGRTWSPRYMDLLKVAREEDLRNNPREERYGFTDLFRYPKLRMETIILTFIWFANTAVYVGLSYYTPHLGGDEFFNFFLSGAVELPTYVFLLQAIEKGGRRWTLCISMIVGGLACLGTFTLDTVPAAVIVLYCIGKMGISCSFVVLPLLASELYPTVVRGIGISFSSVIGQIGPIVIPVVNHLGKDRVILPLIIMGSLSVTGGILSLLLPETLNLHLPQSLEDGEKKRRTQMYSSSSCSSGAK